MDISKEISNWIQYFNKELEDLNKYYRANKNSSDLSEEIALTNSFDKLYKRIHYFLKRCESIQKKSNPNSSQYSSLKAENLRLTQDITSFYIYNNSKIPNRPEYSPEKRSCDLKIEPITTTDLCSDLNTLVKSIKNHKHNDYEKKILELENSFTKMRNKSIYLKQETVDQLKLGKALLKRLNKLEKLGN